MALGLDPVLKLWSDGSALYPFGTVVLGLGALGATVNEALRGIWAHTWAILGLNLCSLLRGTTQNRMVWG